MSDETGNSPSHVSPAAGGPPERVALAAALAVRGIPVDDDQLKMLDRYREAIWSWNEKLNLTRHTTVEKFVSRDVVDSWELAKLLDRGARVMDLGSGGGVPGMIVAILRPDLRVTLCESTQKKARALLAMAEDVAAPVEVFACRAEELLELRTFDAIIARGVAPLAKILGWLAPHWEAFDQLLLVKGRRWADERGEARHRGLLKGLELRRAAVYESPAGEETAESVVLSVTREDAD